MPAPNALPESKAEYVQLVLSAAGCVYRGVVDYALFMYHAEVPLPDARAYIKRWCEKHP